MSLQGMAWRPSAQEEERSKATSFSGELVECIQIAGKEKRMTDRLHRLRPLLQMPRCRTYYLLQLTTRVVETDTPGLFEQMLDGFTFLTELA